MSRYIPGYMLWLEQTEKQSDGWPSFVTEEGKQFCNEMIMRGFKKYDLMYFELIRQCVYGELVRLPGEKLPECLKSSLWDVQLGIVWRAIQGMRLNQMFKLNEFSV